EYSSLVQSRADRICRPRPPVRLEVAPKKLLRSLFCLERGARGRACAGAQAPRRTALRRARLRSRYSRIRATLPNDSFLDSSLDSADLARRGQGDCKITT